MSTSATATYQYYFTALWSRKSQNFHDGGLHNPRFCRPVGYHGRSASGLQLNRSIHVALFAVYAGLVIHVGCVLMTITLIGKSDISSQYSSETTLLSIFLLAVGFGVADALCHAAAFSCKCN